MERILNEIHAERGNGDSFPILHQSYYVIDCPDRVMRSDSIVFEPPSRIGCRIEESCSFVDKKKYRL